VVRLSASEGVKIPHMGWNLVVPVRPGGDEAFYYFVHSYHAVPEDASLISAVTEHGPHHVTAAIERENVLATQFHPEKSQEAGLRLLAAFLA
jgi:glutamine amidotransferase